MRRDRSLLLLVATSAAAVAGCGPAQPVASIPTESSSVAASASREPVESEPTPGSPDGFVTRQPPSDAVLRQVATALETAGVEEPGTDGEYPWDPDLSGRYQGGTAFAYVMDPQHAYLMAEVHGSVDLDGDGGTVTARVHGPELSMVRVPCRDLVVDVTVVTDVERGSDDDEAAAALAQALYPALGC